MNEARRVRELTFLPSPSQKGSISVSLACHMNSTAWIRSSYSFKLMIEPPKPAVEVSKCENNKHVVCSVQISYPYLFVDVVSILTSCRRQLFEKMVQNISKSLPKKKKTIPEDAELSCRIGSSIYFSSARVIQEVLMIPDYSKLGTPHKRPLVL